jgi:hypothetical protein
MKVGVNVDPYSGIQDLERELNESCLCALLNTTPRGDIEGVDVWLHSFITPAINEG